MRNSNRPTSKLCAFLGLAAMLALWASALPAKSPSLDGTATLASVNGEPVTLDEYVAALAEMHTEVEESGPMVARRDPTELLQRLVDVKLLIQEAQSIGLDELPEFEDSMAGFRKAAERSAVLAHATRQAPALNAEEIEQAYRRLVEEIEVATVLFEQRAEAEAFCAALAEGAEFAAAAAEAEKDERAVTYDPARYLPRQELLPAVAQALETLEDQRPSAPIDLGKMFAVIRVSGRRFPENEKAREAATGQARESRRAEAIQSYVAGLREKYLRQDEELFQALDFDVDAAAFEEFLKDERVVAQIDGGEAVRVRDLAQVIRKRLFHGVEQASEKKRLNRLKDKALEQATTDRLIEAEARRLKVVETAELQSKIENYRKALLFGIFVGKIITPSIEVSDAEVRSFYNEHLADYTQPEMIRLESLVFSEPKAAQQALERLNAGADMGWMRSNAPGQVEVGSIPPEGDFDRRILMTSSLPEEVRQAVLGAEIGDVRVYAEQPDRQHVLVVRERFAGTARGFEEVRSEVTEKAYAKKRETILEDWKRQLRAASEVRLMLDGDELRALVSRYMAGESTP